MTAGLDPSLYDDADRFAERASAPRPVVDMPTLIASATTEARAMFKHAAEILTRASLPTVQFYGHSPLIGLTIDHGPGWLLVNGVALTAKGTAHEYGGGTESYFSSRGYKRVVRKLGDRGRRGVARLGRELTVSPPSGKDTPPTLLSTTPDGHPTILYDRYDGDWTTLETWLNDAVKFQLRPR